MSLLSIKYIVLLYYKVFFFSIRNSSFQENAKTKVYALEDSLCVHRVAYMSCHVVLNLLNELRKIVIIGGVPSILSLFCNDFNSFNNTRARMLNSIYHITLR